MPLRFRAVVPYTLPGVLALIGWWWYISRKKEQIIGRHSPEGTAGGLRTSPAEGTNGLLEKGTVSPTHDSDSPTHTPVVVSDHRTEDGNTSQVVVQDADAEPSLEPSSEDPAAGRKTEEFLEPSESTVKPDGPRLNEHKDPELTSELADPDTVQEEITPCQSVKVCSSSPTTAHLSDAERPEPEGEVAKHCGAALPQEEMLVCSVTPAKVQRVIPAEVDSLETPPPAQEFPQNILTSTPTFPALAATTIQDPSTRSEPPEDIQVHSGSREEQDLELLASGLITEVISAATQEVLGVTSCQVTENGHPSSRLYDETAAMAEDSACSTCHSDDGISSEDLQNSTFSSGMDAIQVTDCLAKEATALLGKSATEAASLPETEENSAEAPCDIKSLNGMSLRNGALGTCEVETDQSGGSDVNSMDSVDSGCTMGAGDGQTNHAASSSSDLIVWEIEVPKHLVGRLIGKQGRCVSFLKQNSGAKIYISTLPYTQESICHIEGKSSQHKFQDLDLTNLYAPPPPPLTLPSLPMTSWLLLPSGVTVEVIVVNIVSAGHIFVQQHTHPTYHALRSLDQQMFLCYSQPGTPALPSPAEVGVICAAPAVEGAWWRAQVITFYKDTNEVEIRYVDYGGYDRVKIDALRQIRSDFVTLPFQGAEVLIDNIAPLPGEDRFSPEATSALEEMTRGVALLAQVSNYDNNTGLPLVHLWNMVGDKVLSVNRSLAERGLGVWVDGF
uniref:Tudor domain-containing protein n=1 Tax=Mola mola TaxID=94237 RepID=A0A3Q4B5W3_MOLML